VSYRRPASSPFPSVPCRPSKPLRLQFVIFDACQLPFPNPAIARKIIAERVAVNGARLQRVNLRDSGGKMAND
jgi:hypothetical protein